jgi:hypothetical protein
MAPDLSEMEAHNLELHVKLCVERQELLENRMDHIEEKVDKIIMAFDLFKGDLIKIIIGSGVSLLIAFITIGAAVIHLVQK